MKTIGLFLVFLFSCQQLLFSQFPPDTIYHPFKDGQQIVVLDYTTRLNMRDMYYAQHMSSMPPIIENRPPGNAYIFRDSTGKITQIFNINRDREGLEKNLKPVDFTNSDSISFVPHALYYPFSTNYRSLPQLLKIFSGPVDKINPYDTSVAVLEGYINQKGEIVLPPVYLQAKSYTDFAQVFIPDSSLIFYVVGKNGWGALNIEQDTLVPLQHTYYHQRDSLVTFYSNNKITTLLNINTQQSSDLSSYQLNIFDERRALFRYEEKKRWGLLNGDGTQVVLPPIYQSIDRYYIHDDYRCCAYKGWLLVKKEDKFGIVSITGEEILPCKYDRIYYVTDAPEGQFKVELNKKILFIDYPR